MKSNLKTFMSQKTRKFKAKYLVEFNGTSRGREDYPTTQEGVIEDVLGLIEKTFPYKSLKIKITKIMTPQEYDDVVKMHGKHFKHEDVPAYIRKRDQEAHSLEAQAEDLEQERLCQDAQDNAMADSNYIDRAVEAGREEGREMFR